VLRIPRSREGEAATATRGKFEEDWLPRRKYRTDVRLFDADARREPW
jgi:hypothetical protein